MTDRQPESPATTISLCIPLVSGEAGTARLGGELHYDPRDPFAVTLRVQTPLRTVDWVFSRELLADGLDHPSGTGDVQVWPCRNVRGEAVAVIELIAPTGRGLLQASSHAVRNFITEVFAAVPLGTEIDHLDLDLALEQILS